jgi:hypothetical protein
MKTWGKLMLRAGLAALALGAAGSASAAVVNFDEFAHAGQQITFGPFSSGGFRFTNNARPQNQVSAFGAWGAVRSSWSIDPVAASIYVGESGSTTTVTRDDNSLFDLVSLDMGDLFNQGILGQGLPGVVTFTFNFASGPSLQQVRTTDTLAGGQTFTFNQTALLSFSFRTLTPQNNQTVSQFDNLVFGIGTPGGVPEPASWALMLGGFALTGGALRSARRRGFVKPVLA